MKEKEKNAKSSNIEIKNNDVLCRYSAMLFWLKVSTNLGIENSQSLFFKMKRIFLKKKFNNLKK